MEFDPTRPETTSRPATQHGVTTSADGTTLAWSRQGEGPTIILVDPVMMHRGFSASAGLVPALAAHLTVVTYDRRGRGESTDSETYAPQCEVDDLAALIAAHGGRATLYGFSSGATLALRAARDLDTVDAVIAAEPARDADPDVRDEIRRLVGEDRRAEAIALFNRHIGIPDEIASQMPTAPAEPSAHTIPYDITVLRETPVESYASIACPALILVSEGSQEPLTGWARAAAGAIPGAQFRALPGEWHGIDGTALAEAVVDFAHL